MSEKYIELAQKYGLNEIFETEHNDKNSCTVGFIGNQFCVIQVLSEIFPVLKNNISRASRSFYITIAKGDQNAVVEILPESEHEISFAEFNEKLLECPPLDSSIENLPPFYGKVTLNENFPEGLKFLAVGSIQNFEDFNATKILLEMDVCHLVMSARQLLSETEKKLIVNELKYLKREYLLIHLETLSDTDKQEVLKVIKNFDSQGKVMTTEAVDDLWKYWNANLADRENLVKRRKNIAEAYVKTKLAEFLQAKLEISKHNELSKSNIVQPLLQVQKDLSSKKLSTMRILQVNCLESFKIEIQTELLHFNQKMQDNLRIGVEEENDIKKLQEAMPWYIEGSWREFVTEIISREVEIHGRRLQTLLEQTVCGTVETLLKKYLKVEEYEQIQLIISDSFDPTKNIEIVDQVQPDSIANLGQSKFQKNISRLMPNVFMAAGGLAMFGSLFLPGGLLFIAGYRMYGRISDEHKSQILEQGLEFSNKFFTMITQNFKDKFQETEKSVYERIDHCYDNIVNKIIEIVEEYQNNHDKILNEIDNLQRDIAQISNNNL